MARLSEQEILAFIRSCGLAPAKAKTLKALSELLVDEHGGEVPRRISTRSRRCPASVTRPPAW